METRSRKRAEASTSQQQQQQPPITRAAKRARTSSSSSSSPSLTAASNRVRVVPPTSSITTRSRNQNPSHRAMDLTDSPAPRRESEGRRRKNKEKSSDKGKEKEAEGSRARERERDLDVEKREGMSLDADGIDEDNDGEGGAGLLHHNFTSASSALQGLLRKLGAGLDDLLPSSALSGSSGSSGSHMSSRLKKMLSGLRAEGEEGKQVEALTQLCDMLSIGTEDSLGSFSVDSFVPVLVGLLNHENNPDIMLLAARALTHLCDVLPSSCAAVVHYGAVSCFVARLLTIEYMDLAEQSLQALKKISQEHPTACLRAGALMAVLSYLDFFSTGVQRVALSTAANMCKKLPSDAADFVMEAVPLLTNLLNYHDSKVLDHASVCLTRIAEAFASSPDRLDELCNHGLVSQAVGLISTSNSGGGQAVLSISTYTGLLRLLSTCASGSAMGAKTLHLLGISGILKDILSGSGLVSSISVAPALTRPPEQIFEIVNLADELLPPLPRGTISLPVNFHTLAKGSAVKKSPPCTAGNVEGSDGVTVITAREQLLQDQPELLQQFGMDMLPVLIQIYASSVNSAVRHKSLSVIAKLLYFSRADIIQNLLSATNISSFLSGILAWKDPQVLIPALQIAEILMEKLPGIFSKMFVREGVVHAVDMLILPDSSSPAVQPSVIEKNNDFVTGSSRARRYQRRRSGSTNPDSADETKRPVQGSISSSPGSVDIPASNSSLRTTVSVCAKAFKDKYFPSDSGTTEVGVSDDLIRLKNLCAKLNVSTEDVKSKSKGKSKASGSHSFNISADTEGHLNEVISEMLTELSKGEDGISTFEFIGSGVVTALLNYFSCGTFMKESVSEALLPKLRHQALKRFKSFIAIALPSDYNYSSDLPMIILIQKLHSALYSLERFPVVLSHPSRSSNGNARISSGLGALSQPIKLCLCRARGDKSLRDYSSNVVLIDPLATLAAVEDFLWPRVLRSEASQKSLASAENSEQRGTATGTSASLSTPCPPGRRQSTRSRSSSALGGIGTEQKEGDSSLSKGKGKAVLKSNTCDEIKGPQTRNAARRTPDKIAQPEPTKVDSSSEDDDIDMSPVEMDDALVIEDDDISDDDDVDHDEVLREETVPVCIPEKVLDVKLGDSTDDGTVVSSTSNIPSGPSNRTITTGVTESNMLRGSYFSSRGAMSFAAAAMAGLASGSSRGIRGIRDRRGYHGTSNEPPKLLFSSGGKPLNRNQTIYQAIQRQLIFDDNDDKEQSNGSDFHPGDGGHLWGDIYTIKYQKADSQTDQTLSGTSTSSHLQKSKSGTEGQWQQISLLDSILQGELPCDLEKTNCTYNILALLRVLEGLNQLAPRLRFQAISDDFAEGKLSDISSVSTSGAKVPSEEFVNSKLTPKLTRQMQDALALCSGSLPPWCSQLTKACPFLFPFETKRQFFYSTAFGLSRALHRLQHQGTDSLGAGGEREIRVGRMPRQKVRVSRNRILDSAAKVMEMYSSQKAVLEVEYFGEVGTGLGPTLEFYTLLSHEFQKVGLQMWRRGSSPAKSEMQADIEEPSDNAVNDTSQKEKIAVDSYRGSEDLIHTQLGLFPRPWPSNSDSPQYPKVIEHFRLIGRVMAKALQDGRLLDLPLSAALYKLVLGQELDLHDILSFDAEFGKILQEMQLLVSRKKYLENLDDDNEKEISNLDFHGTLIKDLCLDFTLPGYPDYILKPGEENTVVDISNLEEYISLVVDATVKSGITRQMEAFRAGFNQVFDIASLQIFSPEELDCLLCGRRELWEANTLVEHIKFDHGYTAKSPAIINFLDIMGEFTPEQQRAFCQFVTGAPRLPPGGLAVLNPKLTIVRKLSSTASSTAQNGTGVSELADDDLPSVMTCANYLKLPPYSTKEIMLKKLLFAINEGQGSFDLS